MFWEYIRRYIRWDGVTIRISTCWVVVVPVAVVVDSWVVVVSVAVVVNTRVSEVAVAVDIETGIQVSIIIIVGVKRVAG